MEDVFSFGSRHLAQVNFWFYCAAGFTISLVLYGVMSHRWARRAQFRDWGLVPKPVSATLALMVGLFFVHFAHHTNWLVFYQLAAGPDELQVSYYYPEATIMVPCSEVASVEITAGSDGLHIRPPPRGYRLVIKKTDGSLLQSAACSNREQLATVRETLCPDRR